MTWHPQYLRSTYRVVSSNISSVLPSATLVLIKQKLFWFPQRKIQSIIHYEKLELMMDAWAFTPIFSWLDMPHDSFNLMSSLGWFWNVKAIFYNEILMNRFWLTAQGKEWDGFNPKCPVKHNCTENNTIIITIEIRYTNSFKTWNGGKKKWEIVKFICNWHFTWTWTVVHVCGMRENVCVCVHE